MDFEEGLDLLHVRSLIAEEQMALLVFDFPLLEHQLDYLLNSFAGVGSLEVPNTECELHSVPVGVNAVNCQTKQ